MILGLIIGVGFGDSVRECDLGGWHRSWGLWPFALDAEFTEWRERRVRKKGERKQ